MVLAESVLFAYFDVCNSFINVDSAEKYFWLNKKIDSAYNLVPVMVKNRSGEGNRNFRAPVINQIVKKTQEQLRSRGLKQLAQIYYQIDSQSIYRGGPYGETFKISHNLEYIPRLINKIVCADDCSTTDKLEYWLQTNEYIDTFKRDDKKRYRFKEIANILAGKVKEVNRVFKELLNNETTYDHYALKYFELFEGPFGKFMLTPKMHKLLGAIITPENIKHNNYKLHVENISENHIDSAFIEYLKISKENWNKNYGILFSKQNKDCNCAEDNENSLHRLSELLESSPDIVANTFKENPEFQKDICWIMREIDHYNLNKGNNASLDNATWYLTPGAILIYSIPLILGAIPATVISVSFVALNAYTAVDFYKKYQNLKTEKNKIQSMYYNLNLNGFDKFSFQNINQKEKNYSSNLKDRDVTLAVETVGLLVGAGILKVASKLYKKMSRGDISRYLKSIFEKGTLKERVKLSNEGIENISDVDKFVKVASEKELYKIMLKSKEFALGKALFASETVTEGIKQGYLFHNGKLFLEINPLKLLRDGLGKYEINRIKQNELEMLLLKGNI